nr:MAG TPA: hypothetical protein [Caudoviricetes sp.]
MSAFRFWTDSRRRLLTKYVIAKGVGTRRNSLIKISPIG